MPLVIPIFIRHRGCPHLCLFCNQYAIAGPGDDHLDRAGVGAEIGRWLARSPGHSEVRVAFYGGSFTCLPADEQDELLSGVEPFLLSGEVRAIHLSTRPDCIDPATCERLRGRGVDLVELGVQSFDDGVLRAARRGHDRAASLAAIAHLHQAGIAVGIQLLPGLPGESTGSFLAGIRTAIGLNPALVRLYPTLVLADSGLAAQYRQGEYVPLSLNRAIALCRRAREMFLEAAIPVVRMGLQPSQSLAEQVLAGPYHPSFGELVVSRSWFRQIRAYLGRLCAGQHLTIHLNHRDISAVVGMRKNNTKRLAELGFAGRYQLVAKQQQRRGSAAYVVS